jgi:hypothetical protein
MLRHRLGENACANLRNKAHIHTYIHKHTYIHTYIHTMQHTRRPQLHDIEGHEVVPPRRSPLLASLDNTRSPGTTAASASLCMTEEESASQRPEGHSVYDSRDMSVSESRPYASYREASGFDQFSVDGSRNQVSAVLGQYREQSMGNSDHGGENSRYEEASARASDASFDQSTRWSSRSRQEESVASYAESRASGQSTEEYQQRRQLGKANNLFGAR